MRLPALMVMLPVTLLLSCVTARDRIFMIDPPEAQWKVGDWTIALDMYAYKGVIGADTALSSYAISIYLTMPRGERRGALGQLEAVQIDTIKIRCPNSGCELIMPLKYTTWVSRGDLPELKRNYDFTRSIYDTIPLTDTNCMFEFDARLMMGEHFLTPRYASDVDTVAYSLEDTPKRVINVKIPITRRDSKQRVPFFLDTH